MNPAAQEVKGVAAPLASTWLLRQLLGCGQELLELSLCSAPHFACLLGGVSFKSACARFVLLGTSLRMSVWFEGDTMCCGFSLFGSCIFVGVFLHELFCQAEFHNLVVTRVTRDWVEQYKSLHPRKSDFST